MLTVSKGVTKLSKLQKYIYIWLQMSRCFSVFLFVFGFFFIREPKITLKCVCCKDLLHILSCMFTTWKHRRYQSNGNLPLSSNAARARADVGRHGEYVNYSAVETVKLWKAFKCPDWDVKGGHKRKVQPGTKHSNLSPVPPRLCPDLRLSHARLSPPNFSSCWNRSSPSQL